MGEAITPFWNFDFFPTAFFKVMPNGLTTLGPKVKTSHGWCITTFFNFGVFAQLFGAQ
jgi:hypothetical protein